MLRAPYFTNFSILQDETFQKLPYYFDIIKGFPAVIKNSTKNRMVLLLRQESRAREMNHHGTTAVYGTEL